MAKSQPENLPAAAVNLSTGEEFHVSEFAADLVGALPPFGNVELPLPLDKLNYQHPGPEDRPHLART
jgi:hypothetical protein